MSLFMLPHDLSIIAEMQAINEVETLLCSCCNSRLIDLAPEAYADGNGGYYCHTCAESLNEDGTQAGYEAADKLRFTKPLPKYDRSLEYKCTSEEYSAGNRESYSENAYLAHCRHNCTNYDEIIGNLEKSNLLDAIVYSIVRDAVEELITDSPDYMLEEDEDESQTEPE